MSYHASYSQLPVVFSYHTTTGPLFDFFSLSCLMCSQDSIGGDVLLIPQRDRDTNGRADIIGESFLHWDFWDFGQLAQGQQASRPEAVTSRVADFVGSERL